MSEDWSDSGGLKFGPVLLFGARIQIMQHPLMVLFASALVVRGQDYSWVNFAGSLTANGDQDGGPGASLFTQLYGVDIDKSDHVYRIKR